jgi:hypothetical protein
VTWLFASSVDVTNFVKGLSSRVFVLKLAHVGSEREYNLLSRLEGTRVRDIGMIPRRIQSLNADNVSQPA